MYFNDDEGFWVLTGNHADSGVWDYINKSNSDTIPTVGWIVRDGIKPAPKCTKLEKI